MDPWLVKRLSDLLGSKVRTEAGRSLGRVHDVRAELRPRTVVVTGLVVGRVGLLERLGIGAPESKGRNLRTDVMPWRSVVRADKHGVVVRDKAQR
jgi:sporulation protein YlmC with PRC-barrel domain